MKRIGGLWPRLVEFDNLLAAWRKARRGKRGRDEVARFELDLEPELFGLRDELQSGRYRPGAYRQFLIYERKPQLISAAPFRDRVVHHALMNVVEPALDPGFIPDSYACRQGRGVHAAIIRYQGWAQRYAYALKLDVSRYFPSIDHELLKAGLRRRIKDVRVLDLFDRIIDSAPAPTAAPEAFPGDDLVDLMQRRSGLPIGNLTSQFLGNLYLDGLDHHLKEVCGVRAYLRYVDDLILLDDDKARLWWLRDEIARYLERLRLRLHPCKQQVLRTGAGVDLLGYRVFPGRIRLRRDNGYRYRRRLRAQALAYAGGRLDLADVHASVAAWIGHVQHADSAGLRRAVLGSVSFRRAADRTMRPAGAAGRFVEQQTAEPAFGQPQQEQRG
ncbi:reverse transcriptase domain-containing protein [Plasticicumulans sp.]|uniref:reverse transcriptase domain-containing protein n=1 Tax=Plasticicumulans sp. TaxID=2307179 RepID=UPI00394F83E1